MKKLTIIAVLLFATAAMADYLLIYEQTIHVGVTYRQSIEVIDPNLDTWILDANTPDGAIVYSNEANGWYIDWMPMTVGDFTFNYDLQEIITRDANIPAEHRQLQVKVRVVDLNPPAVIRVGPFIAK